MQKIFFDTRENDRLCREKYALTEELMMENAAAALQEKVMEHVFNPSGFYLNRAHVLILCGKGNNGADGYALARRLMSKKIAVTVLDFEEPATEMAKLQKSRAELLGVGFIDLMELDDFIERQSVDLRVVVDCIFGSGFHGELPYEVAAVLEVVNGLTDPYKIACDVPSGMAFTADVTVTMGALKQCLFEEKAKDACGQIVVADLGIARTNFENTTASEPAAYLLEKSEMELPLRKKQNVNKGSFGHLAVVHGEKKGAGMIAGSAALRFGAGLVTLVDCSTSENDSDIEEMDSRRKTSSCCEESGENLAAWELMYGNSFPEKCTAVAFGMGLGRDNRKAFERTATFLLESGVACVVDADAFYIDGISEFLRERSNRNVSERNRHYTVITPHPKEFAQLLKTCGLGDYSVEQVVSDRFSLASSFCEAFPGIVLVLKGANVIVAVKNPGEAQVKLYVNTYGTNALSKGGSGDVLAGMAGALLAQKQQPLQAAVNASLAHTEAASVANNSFSLTPSMLLRGLEQL